MRLGSIILFSLFCQLNFYQIVLIMYHFWKHCPYTPVPRPCAAILPVQMHEALNLMTKKKKSPQGLKQKKTFIFDHFLGG